MNSQRLLFGLAGAVLFSAAQLHSQEPVDLSIVHRIKAEAFENSKVMDHEFYLADVYGPRLTDSPGYQAAGDWVVKRLQGVWTDQCARGIVGTVWPELDLHALLPAT